MNFFVVVVGVDGNVDRQVDDDDDGKIVSNCFFTRMFEYVLY